MFEVSFNRSAIALSHLSFLQLLLEEVIYFSGKEELYLMLQAAVAIHFPKALLFPFPKCLGAIMDSGRAQTQNIDGAPHRVPSEDRDGSLRHLRLLFFGAPPLG